jgi:ATP-dependent exoDNAse (exonuclease V) alpha subunit
LAYNNSTRIKVNHRWMEYFSRRADKFIVVDSIPGKEKHTQETKIYVGLPMIAIESKKHKDFEISNAEEFIVVSFNKKEVKLKYVFDDDNADEETIKVPIEMLPYLLQPAYCISIHRSQCSTYRVPYTIYQTDKMAEMDENGGDLGKRLLYVALSRADNIDKINISNEY